MAVGKPNPIGALTGANDGLADGIIGHAVSLERLKAGEIQAVYSMLRKVQGDLIEQLNSLDPTAVGGKAQTKRLVRLLKQTQATIKANYSAIQKAHAKTLTKVADLEGKAIQQAVGKGVAGDPRVGVVLVSALPPATTLRALVNDTLIMGAPQKEHWARQAGDLQQRFQDQMREGILAGESVDDLVRRVRGTKANAFKDGIMEVKRYQAAALVRTSVQGVSNAARNATIEANKDIFNGVQWLSTLDSRTSDICKARSGLRWDNDFKPIGHNKSWSPPPAHWNCRSVVTPITKTWEELAGKQLTRDANDFTDAFKDELAKAGFTADQIANIKPRMQSSMDGQVPAEFDYEDWIKSKPKRFQQDVLGLAKWRLWSSGKISFVDLVDQRSNPLTLAQLEDLIEKGKTSIARASAAAKKAAQADADAAAKEAAALAKKETQAENLLATYAAGGPGFTNQKKVFDKLTKQGKLEGLSFQEQVKLVEAGKDAIIEASKLAKVKKAISEGKKLSPSLATFYKALDQATKAEIRTLKAANQLQKQVTDEYDSLIAKYLDNAELSPATLKAYGLDDLTDTAITKQLGKTPDLADKLSLIKVTKSKLDNVIADEKMYASDIKDYLTATGDPTFLLSADKVAEIVAKGGAKKQISDALDEAYEAQVQVVAKANQKAAAKLDEYSKATKATGGVMQKKALEELKKTEKGFNDLDPIVQLEKVEAKTLAQKQYNDFAKNKSVISALLAQGKKLNDTQKQWVAALDEDGQDLLQAAVAKKQKSLGVGPEAPKPPPTTPDNKPGLVFDDFEQIGPQAGSNLGGLFRNNRTGTEYYIKAPENELAARVEVLSAKLYQAAGVRVADIDLMPITGKIGGTNAAGRLGIASRIEDVQDITPAAMRDVNGAQDGFAVDAWLANWDVIGNGGVKELNLKKLADGSAMRIDTGGSLFFRARGGRKAFDADDVPELDSLRFFPNNENARKVFGDISEDKIVAGVARIVAISDDDIRRLVDDLMGDDAGDLAQVLIGRKNFLANKYKTQLEKLNKPQPTPDIGVAEVTRVDLRTVERSKKTGYTLSFDKDSVEDQAAHFWKYRQNRQDGFGVSFKIRGAASKKFNAVFRDAGGSGANSIDLSDLNERITNAVKGIAYRANKGEFFERKDYERAISAMEKYRDTLDELNDLVKDGRLAQDVLDEFKVIYKPWIDDLTESAKISSGDLVAAVWKPHTTEFFAGLKTIALKAAEQSGWVKITKQFNKADLKDANTIKYTSQTQARNTETEAIRLVDDNVTIDYIPSSSRLFALRDTVDVRIIGSTLDDLNKGLRKLDALGFDLSRPNLEQQEILYLTRFLYMKGAKKMGISSARRKRAMEALERPFTNDAERLEFLRKEASYVQGVKDITQMPAYRPDGSWEKIGYGRHLQYRPDLNGPDWEDFKTDHVLWHDITYMAPDREMNQRIKNIMGGGGHLAPTTDKLRRGLPLDGASAQRDLETGGASYAFTRIRTRANIRNLRGVFFKPDALRRIDAISYDRDHFGRMRYDDGRAGFVEDERYSTIEGFRKLAADNGTNETVFKNSLSMIDEDVLFIQTTTRAEYEELLEIITDGLKALGFDKWPDGREITDVVRLVGRG